MMQGLANCGDARVTVPLHFAARHSRIRPPLKANVEIVRRRAAAVKMLAVPAVPVRTAIRP